MTTPADKEIRPFTISATAEELADLRRRLAAARWAPPVPDGRPGHRTTRARTEELARHWRDEYDWRAWEGRLNQYPQYTTTIDGTNIHFLHVRSPEPDAVPLILSHGWPGSVVEFLDVIGPLSDPVGHRLSAEISFDLVIPSLPGFTWSGPTPDTGWGPRRIARAWSVLMERLGYPRYGAAGNDWGSHVSPELGRVAKDAVIGVHVTQLFSLPPGEWLAYPPSVKLDDDSLATDDREALRQLRDLQTSAGSYAHVQGQRPHVLGLALSDSPLGLLAWNSQVMNDLDPDTLLTHVTAYWLTGTAASAITIYAEREHEPVSEVPTSVPLALAQFPDDFRSIRAYAERDHANIVSWNVYDRGGHYAAHQAPDLLVQDIRAFYTSVPRNPA